MPKKCIKYSLIVCLVAIIIYLLSNNVENYSFEQIKSFEKKDKNTPMNEGGGDVKNLDRHKVECDGLVSQLKLTRSEDGKKYAYGYKCLNKDDRSKLVKDKVKQTSKVTPTGKSIDLVGKEINCYDPNDADKGLVSFQYMNKDGKAYYDYTCGKIVSKTKQELEKEDEYAENIKNTLKSGNRIRLKSYHKDDNGKYRYLRGFSDATTGAGGEGKAEVFRLKKLKDNKWALFSERERRFIKADTNKVNVSLTQIKSHYNDFPDGWNGAKFNIVDVGEGKIGLKSTYNRWIAMSGPKEGKYKIYQGSEGKDLAKDKGMTWQRFEMISISKEDNKHFDDIVETEKKAREDEGNKINNSKPKTAGCYVYANKGEHGNEECKSLIDGKWKRDKYGEVYKNTFFDEKQCHARAKDFKDHCKSNVEWRTHYNKYNNKHTKAYKNGGGNAVYLDGHNIDCGTGKFIKSINLKNLGDQYSYLYKCS